MWIAIDPAARDGAARLVRLLDGVWCVARWSQASRGWMRCADSSEAGTEPVHPTHYMNVPDLSRSQPKDLATFRVYRNGEQAPGSAVEISAATPYDAAIAFVTGDHAERGSTIAVIGPDGAESVFGYRQAIPQAHLDD
jgi:hypothetical protein